MEFHFTSRLQPTMRDKLENILFFNSLQKNYIESISHSIQLFGEPKVELSDNSLRVLIDGIPDIQTIFALTPDKNTLAGIIIYLRTDQNNIAILHIGVTNEFSSLGTYADSMLAPKLIQNIIRAAKTIKGITTITLMYGRNKLTKIKL